jgi:hypothetical protein
MQITSEWLKQHKACVEGMDWFVNHSIDSIDHADLYRCLRREGRDDWACWLLGTLGGAELAVRCVLRVCETPEWVAWAEKWLAGEGREEETLLKVVCSMMSGIRPGVVRDAVSGAARACRYQAASKKTSLPHANNSIWQEPSWAAAAGHERSWATDALECVMLINPDIDILAILEECSSWK